MGAYPNSDVPDSIGDPGNGPDDTGTEESEETDPIADLMRSDEDPLPDAQVPGIGPDGQAPNTPA